MFGYDFTVALVQLFSRAGVFSPCFAAGGFRNINCASVNKLPDFFEKLFRENFFSTQILNIVPPFVMNDKAIDFNPRHSS